LAGMLFCANQSDAVADRSSSDAPLGLEGNI
jgi:hypothetical protein